MKVLLDTPFDWVSQPRGALRIYQIFGVPGLRVMLTPLAAYPEDPADWIRRQFTTEAIPAGARVRMVVGCELATRDGWPASYTEGVIGDGPTAESRGVALWRFLDLGAGAIVRCPDPSLFAQQRGAVLDALGSARPDWGAQETLCLASLFEGVVRPPPTS